MMEPEKNSKEPDQAPETNSDPKKIGTVADIMHRIKRVGKQRDPIVALHRELSALALRVIPLEMGHSGLVSVACNLVPADVVSAANVKLIVRKIAALETTARFNYSRELVSMSPDYISKAKHSAVTKAAKIKVPKGKRGTIAATHPMGVGKTVIIVKQIVDDAKANGETVMAICPRISLTATLANVLKLPHYAAVKAAKKPGIGHNSDDTVAEHLPGLATCLPSIVHPAIRAALPNPDIVVLEEVAQILQLFTAGEIAGSAILAELIRLVSNARVVVVADAHCNPIVEAFLKICRPNDPVYIQSMKAPKNGKTARFVSGPRRSVRGKMIAEIAAILNDGGNVWIACETRKMAEVVHRALIDGKYLPAKDVLTFTGRNKEQPRQIAFSNDPEGQSRRYRAVIHSPALQSGVSITHLDDHHFAKVFFFGSCHILTPAVCAQMVRRVRYVDEIVFGIERRTARTLRTFKENQLVGWAGLAVSEQDNVAVVLLDKLRSAQNALDRDARSGGGGSLVYEMDAQGYNVLIGSDAQPIDDTLDLLNGCEQLMADLETNDFEFIGNPIELAEQAEAQDFKEAVMEADIISPLQYESLKAKRSIEFDDDAATVAYEIRAGLGIDGEITSEHYDDWKDGMGGKVEFYQDVAPEEFLVTRANNSGRELSNRSARRPRLILGKELMPDGLPLALTAASLAALCDAMFVTPAQRHRAVEAGLLDRYWSGGYTSVTTKRAKLIPAPGPQKSKVDVVRRLYDKAGLSLHGTRIISEKAASVWSHKHGITLVWTGDETQVYEVNPERLAKVQAYSVAQSLFDPQTFFDAAQKAARSVNGIPEDAWLKADIKIKMSRAKGKVDDA